MTTMTRFFLTLTFLLVSFRCQPSSCSQFQMIDLEPPSENSTDYEDYGDDFRNSRPLLKKSSEEDLELDPALEADPLKLAAVALPGDYVGRSILGVVKVVQMFRMVGAPLSEPYSEVSPPGPPAAPGAPPAAPSSAMNYLPYLFMMNSGMMQGGGGSYHGGYGGGGGSG